MRKIEMDMVKAINERRNWQNGNTMVSVNRGVAHVYLFGHEICRVNYDKGTRLYSNCGYQTQTTRSRLVALGLPVKQIKGVWYVGEKVFKNQFHGRTI